MEEQETPGENKTEETAESDKGTVSAKEKAAEGRMWTARDRNIYMLSGLLAGLVAILLLSGVFAAGYFTGRERGNNRREVMQSAHEKLEDFRENRGSRQGERGVRSREGVMEDIRESPGVEIVRGKVVSMEGDTLVIETESGNVTIKVVSDTRYMGGKVVKAGEMVIAIAKTGDQGVLTAITVRGVLPGDRQ